MRLMYGCIDGSEEKRRKGKKKITVARELFWMNAIQKQIEAEDAISFVSSGFSIQHA